MKCIVETHHGVSEGTPKILPHIINSQLTSYALSYSGSLLGRVNLFTLLCRNTECKISL